MATRRCAAVGPSDPGLWLSSRPLTRAKLFLYRNRPRMPTPHTGFDNSKRARRAHGSARSWRLPGLGRRWSYAPLSGEHLPVGVLPMAIMGSASPSPGSRRPSPYSHSPRATGLATHTRRSRTDQSPRSLPHCPVGRLALMLTSCSIPCLGTDTCELRACRWLHQRPPRTWHPRIRHTLQ